MKRLAQRCTDWLRQSLRGASAFVSSVFVAVLLAPVLPDVFVELAGDGGPPWRAPALRGAAVLLVVVVAVAVFRLRERSRIRAARRGAEMHGLAHVPVLVLPLSPERKRPTHVPTYTAATLRRGDPTVAERLIDSIRPELVVCVVTPQFEPDDLARLTEALKADGTSEVAIVRLDDGMDPTIAITDTCSRLLALVEQRGLTGEDINVDITGGTKTMTLALARAASLIGADCVYVASEYRRDAGNVLPGTQKPYRFAATELLAVS